MLVFYTVVTAMSITVVVLSSCNQCGSVNRLFINNLLDSVKFHLEYKKVAYLAKVLTTSFRNALKTEE